MPLTRDKLAAPTEDKLELVVACEVLIVLELLCEQEFFTRLEWIRPEYFIEWRCRSSEQ